MNNPNQFLDLSSIYGIPPCNDGDCTQSPQMEQTPGYGFTAPFSPLPQNQQQMRTPMQQGTQMQNFPQQQMQQTNPLAPITPITQPMPVTAESMQYLNGFLRTQIGRNMRVEFLIGTNTLTDKTGTLLAVGANYILLNEAQTDDILACDFYNIKFITIYY